MPANVYLDSRFRTPLLDHVLKIPAQIMYKPCLVQLLSVPVAILSEALDHGAPYTPVRLVVDVINGDAFRMVDDRGWHGPMPSPERFPVIARQRVKATALPQEKVGKLYGLLNG
jgi:hypothetical protein